MRMVGKKLMVVWTLIYTLQYFSMKKMCQRRHRGLISSRITESLFLTAVTHGALLVLTSVYQMFWFVICVKCVG